MTLADVDWRLLRGALILLALSIAIGGGSLAASFAFSEEQEQRLQRARAQYLNARARYQTLDEEEDVIATYLPRYVALEEGGVIGREQRLDWIDSLRESARAVRVPNLQYTIDPQQRFDSGVAFEAGEYRLYASTVRLNMGLLHEGDLFNLLDRFRRQVAGLFGVKRCELRRRGLDLEMNPAAVNVQADCELQFITIRRDAREGA